MKLLKIIIIFFAIYFIRRFLQLYRTLKALEHQKGPEARANPNEVIEAEFTVK